jgi:hypothetical protein
MPRKWETLESSHPMGMDRIQALCKAFNEQSGSNVCVNYEFRTKRDTLRSAFLTTDSLEVTEIDLPESKKDMPASKMMIKVVNLDPK